MKISKHLSGVKVKRSLPKLSLPAKLAFASVLLLNLEASAGIKANKNILDLAVFSSAHLSINNFVDISVSGRVLDEKGQPLIGVSVKVKGVNTGVSTDVNGGFTIEAPENGTLVLSYVGYATQEFPVNGKTSIIINLKPSTTTLNEVVVTALGIRKDERKLGYSVSTVSGEDLNKARESNVALSLSGKVAGLSVTGTNGGPGSSSKLLLRGLTSFTAGSPLYVINGVPMDNTQRGAASEWGGADYGDGIANINPDDIETMTVLKGQSASALYGSRAVNGVVLITTKSGKKNSGFGVEFNSNIQFDKPVDNTDYQTTYGQGQLAESGILGIKPRNAAEAVQTGNLAWGTRLDGSSVPQLDGSTGTYSNKSNYLSFYRTAPSFTNTVALTGGGDASSFRLSVSDLRGNSIVPNSYLDRKTFNFNGNQSVTKKLDINIVANYLVETSKNRAGLSDGPGNPNNVQFIAPNVDQNILSPSTGANGRERTFTNDTYVTNPYFAAYNFQNNTQRKRLISSLSAKYNFTDWVFAQARVGYDNINDLRISIEPTGTAYRGDNGTMTQYNYQTNEFNADVLINAKHDLIKDFLNLDLSLGGNIRKSDFGGTSIGGNGGFIIPYYYSLTNFGSRNTSLLPDQTTKKQVNSAYYSADFGIKDYLVLSTTGRYDTYSSISSTVGRGIFSPSVLGSFIFSDLFKIKNVDLGKVRVSYAQTSNDANAYANQVYYNVN
ncbi:MAG: SusC/RagA family TonB-linked outer membrane protein, partial [Sphingobacteriaceae bacterium]